MLGAGKKMQLIEKIKEYPVLFDCYQTDFKNRRSKEKVWKKLGEDLHITATEAKRNWKTLRDTYVKYLRANKYPDDPFVKKNYVNWSWAPMMEYFNPFLRIRDRLFEIPDDDDMVEETNDPPLKEIKIEDVSLSEEEIATPVTKSVPELRKNFLIFHTTTPIATPTSTFVLAGSDSRVFATAKASNPPTSTFVVAGSDSRVFATAKASNPPTSTLVVAGSDSRVSATAKASNPPTSAFVVAGSDSRVFATAKASNPPTSAFVVAGSESRVLATPKVNNPPASTTASAVTTVQQKLPETRVASPEMDATDFMFLGYSKVIKTFCPRSQAIAKMKIAQIIMEMELEQIDKSDAASTTPCIQHSYSLAERSILPDTD